MSADSKEGIISSHIHADGQYNDLLSVEGNHIKMKGNEVFKVAVNTLSKLVDETLDKNNMDNFIKAYKLFVNYEDNDLILDNINMIWYK